MWLERQGLIEVDPMPTLEGEITPNLEMWTPLLLIKWSGNGSSLSLDLSLRAKDVTNNEP